MSNKVWTCKNCGMKGNTSLYCMECGKPRPDSYTKPRKKEKRRWKTVALLSVVAIVIIAAVVRSELKQTSTEHTAQTTVKHTVQSTAQSASVKSDSSLEKETEISKQKTADESSKLRKNEKIKDEAANGRKMKTDLSLGGFDLGMTVEQMHKIMGKEISHESINGMTVYQYPDIKIGAHGNIITSLVSENGSVKTKRGVGQGDNFKAVQASYGKDAMKMEYGDMILYEYNYKDLDGRSGILRFAVKRGTEKVDYISVRIPDFKG